MKTFLALTTGFLSGFIVGGAFMCYAHNQEDCDTKNEEKESEDICME